MGKSGLLLSQGWVPHHHYYYHHHHHQVLEALEVGPLRQGAGSLGQWIGWDQGPSRRYRKVGSAQVHFQQMVLQEDPL